MTTKPINILVDGREFVRQKSTGIGRFLEGLVRALAQKEEITQIRLAVTSIEAVPLRIKHLSKVKLLKIPESFLKSEKALSRYTKKNIDLFISPYPKLAVFGVHCPSVNTVHDVLDLVHPAYKKCVRSFIDILRLRKSLKKAKMTWYDSLHSMKATKNLIGYVGENAQVRYPALDEKFNIYKAADEAEVLQHYNIAPGYILTIGNGLPHKNLGVLLQIANTLERKLVLIGTSENNQNYWEKNYPGAQAIWISHVKDSELPTIVRNAFCLAQPSTAEGYGYPPLEAMASGVPAVVSNIPVLTETTGGNACVADADDPTEWKEAFESLENKDLYKSMTEKGLTWANAFCGLKGWKKHVADIEELIRQA